MNPGARRKIEAEIRAAVNEAVLRAAALVLRRVKELLSQARTERDSQRTAPTNSPPAAQTGTLLRSYAMDSKPSSPDPNTISARVGTNLVYAKIHEFGGVISPKTGRYLTIPIGKTGRKIRRQYRSLRDVSNTFFVRSKRDNLVLMKRQSKKKSVPIALLKERVVMPARPHLRPAFAQTREAVKRIIAEAVRARK